MSHAFPAPTLSLSREADSRSPAHRFHLFAGASILQGNGLLDLDTFVASFPALEAFTFLGDPSLNTNSSFDRILESQPSLLYLHLRADFIRCVTERDVARRSARR